MHCEWEGCVDETGVCIEQDGTTCEDGYWGSRCTHSVTLGKYFHDACKFAIDKAFTKAITAHDCILVAERMLVECGVADAPLDEIPVAPELFCVLIAGVTQKACDKVGLVAFRAAGLEHIEQMACGSKVWFPRWADNLPTQKEIRASPVVFTPPLPPAWPEAFTAEGTVQSIGTGYNFTVKVSAASRQEAYLRDPPLHTGFVTGYRQFCQDSTTMAIVSLNMSHSKNSTPSLLGCAYANTSFESCLIPPNYLETILARRAVNYSKMTYNGTRGSSDVWLGRQEFQPSSTNSNVAATEYSNFSIAYLSDHTSGFPVALETYDTGTENVRKLLQTIKFKVTEGEPAIEVINTTLCVH
jgi:hypothetical protein